MRVCNLEKRKKTSIFSRHCPGSRVFFSSFRSFFLRCLDLGLFYRFGADSFSFFSSLLSFRFSFLFPFNILSIFSPSSSSSVPFLMSCVPIFARNQPNVGIIVESLFSNNFPFRIRSSMGIVKRLTIASNNGLATTTTKAANAQRTASNDGTNKSNTRLISISDIARC